MAGPAEASSFVEVVYATPDVQRVVRIELVAGLTAGQAVEASGLLEEFPEIPARPLVLGLFGERVSEQRELVAGDRIELCRPLERDPRDRRRELAR